MLDWLLEKMSQAGDTTAIANGAAVCTYRELLGRVADWQQRLVEHGVANKVVSIEAEYGAEAVAVFLAATNAGNILVPISAASGAHRDDFNEIGEVEYRLRPDLGAVEDAGEAGGRIIATGRTASHPHYVKLREAGSPGLVLFSSGSTGKHKAAVHDLSALLKKFTVPRHCYRTLVFLQLDHIGGVNTLFTRSRTPAPSSSPAARRARCARRSRCTGSSCCRPRRRSSTCSCSPKSSSATVVAEADYLWHRADA